MKARTINVGEGPTASMIIMICVALFMAVGSTVFSCTAPNKIEKLPDISYPIDSIVHSEYYTTIGYYDGNELKFETFPDNYCQILIDLNPNDNPTVVISRSRHFYTKEISTDKVILHIRSADDISVGFKPEHNDDW